jgi:hypothetical protein
MKKLLSLLLLVGFVSCEKDFNVPETQREVLAGPFPAPSHVIFVWLENKNYTQIINSTSAPYINSLIPQGTLFTNDHALGHPSYPEYIRFFSGTNNGKTNDDCLSGAPYTNVNLYTQLKARGKSFAWYSEDLPATGSGICSSGAYVERHNPTQCFSNVALAANKRWLDFPLNYSQLETVVCITPNLNNDMHDGSIAMGDTWVKIHLSSLINWCKVNNSVFVIYFDEDNGTVANHIAVIAVGQHVKSNYKSDVYYDHYSWTKTVLAFYGAMPIGDAVNRELMVDCWK